MQDPQITYFLKFAAKVFGGDRPRLFCALFLLGQTMPMVGRILHGAFPDQKWLGQIGEESPVLFSALLVGISFAGVAIRGKFVPESVSTDLAVFDKILERAGLPKSHEKMYWRRILDRYLISVDPKLGLRANSNEIAKDALREVKDDPPTGGEGC